MALLLRREWLWLVVCLIFVSLIVFYSIKLAQQPPPETGEELAGGEEVEGEGEEGGEEEPV
ncbi:MAG: hypothetical protein QM219_04325, partial [Bacillota bacterium]|nr:hypothetical protein [Bacillota bacterium]